MSDRHARMLDELMRAYKVPAKLGYDVVYRRAYAEFVGNNPGCADHDWRLYREGYSIHLEWYVIQAHDIHVRNVRR